MLCAVGLTRLRWLASAASWLRRAHRGDVTHRPGVCQLHGAAHPAADVVLGWVADFVAANPATAAALGEDAVLMPGAPIAGPLVEEVTKGLGLLLLFVLLGGAFDNMRDGLIYGALIGLGFTWIEAPLYVAKGYGEYSFAPWNFQFGYRYAYALFGFSGYPLYTGLFGAALGLSWQVRARWLRWLLPPGGLLLGIAAHALNNGLGLIAVGITGQAADRCAVGLMGIEK